MSVSDDVSMDYYQKKLMAESWCSQISAGAVASVEGRSPLLLFVVRAPFRCTIKHRQYGTTHSSPSDFGGVSGSDCWEHLVHTAFQCQLHQSCCNPAGKTDQLYGVPKIFTKFVKMNAENGEFV